MKSWLLAILMFWALMVMVGLKLANAIVWPWLWVLFPAWAPLVFFAALGILTCWDEFLAHTRHPWKWRG